MPEKTLKIRFINYAKELTAYLNTTFINRINGEDNDSN